MQSLLTAHPLSRFRDLSFRLTCVAIVLSLSEPPPFRISRTWFAPFEEWRTGSCNSTTVLELTSAHNR